MSDYETWRNGYEQGRATERAEAAPLPLSARVPSRWLADNAIAEAVRVLEANPDLQADDDIALCLGSEASEALDFVNAFAAAILSCDDAARMARERIVTLRERERVMQERGETLRSRLTDMLERMNLRRVETPCGTVSMKLAKARVIIADEAAVDPRYMRTTVTRSPDKTAIHAAWARGETVAGATPSNRGMALSISVRP